MLHSTLLVNGYAYVWGTDDAVAVALRYVSGETDFTWLSEFIKCWTAPTGVPVPMEPSAVPSAMVSLRRDGVSP